MKKYLTHLITKEPTPQSAPLPETTQVANSAGGYSWAVDEWGRLRRFLILGSEGGSYYASERTLTLENANNVLKCIQEDGVRAVNEIVTISQEGRAPKNDPAIFALVLAVTKGDEATRQAAFNALPEVCRTGTHLFTFAELVNGMRGWGRGLRRAVGGWYKAMDNRSLAYQLVKYRQRNGWSHTDTLRLAHPMPVNDTQGAIFKWVTYKPKENGAIASGEAMANPLEWAEALNAPEDKALAFIWAFERVQKAADVETVVQLIEAYDLPREALPTQWLNDADVWATLLTKMPMTALIRNLGLMSRIGLLKPLSEAENVVVERLTNADLLQKARVHPIAVLIALRAYSLGYALKGKVNRRGYVATEKSGESGWMPTPRILDALDKAFELAFKNVEPTNKRIMLALDVSGSMSSGMVAGVPGLTPREGSAAMAMVTARSEPNYTVISFQDKIVPLNISARMRLTDVVNMTNGLPFGRTDCAQPMLYAMEKKIAVDTFVVYTDNETWANPQLHPVQALNQYREKMAIPAKLVVVGMVSNGFTIADPNDAGMLDMVGFDASAPALIADFARGGV
ncbi:MAG: TROVE domain-containing protein [Chloroflexi bacterium]|nr:TROVE domain-containing protein [Chloroflexota bacterium]